MGDAKNADGPLRFMSATVVRDDLTFIIAQVDALNASDVDHTKVLRWKSGNWAHYMLDWPAISIAHTAEPSLAILNLGLYGEIHVAAGSSKWTESVDDTRERPGNRGPLREMRVINGLCHVCGMQRQVYCRTGPSNWTRLDQGSVLPLNSSEIVSFDSIDGFKDGTLYAVGMDGAIWCRSNKDWRALESPTSIGLQKVLCVGDIVYAAGQFGTLLCGLDNRWQVIDTHGLADTIWDLCWFRGALYAATSTGLYRWTGNRLEAVDVGLGSNWSFGSLAANNDVLWSVGRTRLAMTSDGVTWLDVTCKDGSY